jgi:hypothetical protein
MLRRRVAFGFVTPLLIASLSPQLFFSAADALSMQQRLPQLLDLYQ